MKLYGIKNCDTVKKARKWLETHGLDCGFHDLREDGLDLAMVETWLRSVPADQLVNRRSTTWKSLDGEIRDNLRDSDIPQLLVAHPTLVKRPVLERNGKILVGFSEPAYKQFLDL